MSLIPKEAVLKEIERLIQNNANTRPMPHPDQAGGIWDRECLAIWQILGFIKDFIQCLPSPPEVERWVLEESGTLMVVSTEPNGNGLGSVFIRRADNVT